MNIEEPIKGLIESEQLKADTHFRKAKRADIASTLILRAAAGLTLAILVYILGFILYRGFRSDNIIESEFIDRGTIETPLMWYDEKSVLIVNRKTRLNVINHDDLASLLSGKPSNWGNINGQDLKVTPYLFKSAHGEFGRNTTYKGSVKEIAAAVEHQSGALGLIPAAEADQLKGYDIKIIPVEPLVIAVNPSVYEIKDNIKLRFIDGVLLKKILRGEIKNWKDAGGTDQEIRLIIPPQGSYEFEAFSDIAELGDDEIPAWAEQTAGMDEYAEKIKNTAGAAGIILKNSAAGHEMELLKYQFHKTGRNLQLWFLLEEPKRAGRVGGVSSIIINTVYMVLLTILFSTPLGIGAAVYLTEYARQGLPVRILRLGTETLAGIPSILFGLFGFIVFVGAMHLGIGLLSGTLTLTLMILPTIIRTSEEAIKAVPKSFRAGSLALGAGKWQTIYKVVIPAAAPGILTGVILGIGRAVGETAALLFTMGFDYRRVENLSTSARVLSTHLYQLVKEGISFDRAFATATILIVIVLFVNIVSTKLVIRKY